ncbi:MAG: F0F1 ATP synthase subunit B [Oscillospiraceae bacterium]|nr:F0F1 ATP synthase subunit B [Oscillospiraceae bacterium]
MEFLTGFESFVGVNPWTCLFTLCNLLILYKFMKKLLFKPVKNMIDSRQQEIDDLYADANSSKEAAAELKRQYEARLTEANAEKEAILKDAYRKAQLRDEEMLREAQEKASQTLRRADEQIALEKKRAMNDIKDEVSVMAVDIASAVLARDIKRSEHSELIDSFIENLGERHD